MNTSELSIVIPVYNEAGNLPVLQERLARVLGGITENYEVLWVNDHSRDETLALLRQLAAADARHHYISFSRNFGHQKAICAGLDKCRGNAVVIMDGDLQDPPELIPALYEKYREGYKVVYAQRRARKGETVFKKTSAALFYRLMRNTTHINIPVDTGDFRLIDRQVVDYLKKMPEQHKFLRGQIAWIGFRQTSVLYDRESRHSGKTGYSLSKMIRFAVDGITAFSDLPLRLATVSGFTVSFVAFLVILYALYSKFALHQVITGWTSLIISTMFIGGIQLLTIGIIGEYISRINNDVRGRPLYIIEEASQPPGAETGN
ncbi:MAG: yfdH [Flaviaesturariibacter sp.]|nr:yfdH [Flaviaesturariibacter sp.]